MAPNRLSQGIVLTLSAEPLELPSAPLRFLLKLRQLAGGARKLITYTKSLATLFGCCSNTIRRWRDALLEAGYIHWETSPRTGQTCIYIREKVEPPSRRAKLAEQRRIDALPEPLPWQKPKPVVLPPDPKPWWRLPLDKAWQKSAALSKRCDPPATFLSPIKPSKKQEAVDVDALARKWGFLPTL